ncbi:MAG: hypothetical protein ACR2O3_11565 [Rhizobiaceae bacterium]
MFALNNLLSRALLASVLVGGLAGGELSAHGATCEEFTGWGKDRGISQAEYKKPGGWQKSQQAGKQASERAILDWKNKVTLSPGGYLSNWQSAKKKFVACEYESEEVYDIGFEWGWVRCYATATACVSKRPEHKVINRTPKCDPNDLKCKAKLHQYKSKEKPYIPPVGPKMRIIIQQ